MPGAVVVIDERVDQLGALVAADRLLVADRAGGRPRAGERAGRRPPLAVGGAFEVGEHSAGRRRGVDGRRVVRVIAAADEEVQVRAGDRERRRGQRARAAILSVEAVGQAAAQVSGDAALGRDVALRGSGAERVTGRRPALVARPVEAREQRARRWRVVAGDVVGAERRAVEVADEVLHARAAGDPARVEADQHHPLGLVALAVDLEREQVRALPGAADRVGGPEIAQVRPRLEVLRAVDRDFALHGLDGDHSPFAGWLVPEHLRVAELAVEVVEHRVTGVLGPGPTAVGAVGQRLILVVRPRARVDRHHRRVAARAEAARVLVVDHRATREDRLVSLLRDRDGQLLPVHEIAADRVTPRHVAPRVPERVVLVEEVILALVVDEPVGVVHPVLGRSEMKLRPVELLVAGGVRSRRSSRRSEQHGCDGGEPRATTEPTATRAALTLLHGILSSSKERRVRRHSATSRKNVFTT